MMVNFLRVILASIITVNISGAVYTMFIHILLITVSLPLLLLLLLLPPPPLLLPLLLSLFGCSPA